MLHLSTKVCEKSEKNQQIGGCKQNKAPAAWSDKARKKYLDKNRKGHEKHEMLKKIQVSKSVEVILGVQNELIDRGTSLTVLDLC